MRCGTWARLHPRPGRLRRLPWPGRLVGPITALRLPARLDRRERQPGEVRPPERFGAPPPLLGRQDSRRISLALELGEEGCPGLRGSLLRVAMTVLGIGGQPRPEASFSRTYRLVPCHCYLAISSDQQGSPWRLAGHH